MRVSGREVRPGGGPTRGVLAVGAALALLGLAAAGRAAADEIFFKNGDRLTGEIVTMEGGKMKFKSKTLGELTVPMSELEAFKSDGELDLRLGDGTAARARVEDGATGEVRVAPGTPGERKIPPQAIRAINPGGGWSGQVLFGGQLARGNTDTESASFNADVERKTDIDRWTAGGTYLFGRQKDQDTGEKVTTTDNWNVRTKYDYFINPQWYAYGNVKVESDEIARLRLRVTPGAGMGYQWTDAPEFKFSTEAGLTYVYERFDPSEEPEDGFRDRREYLGGRLAYKMEGQAVENVNWFHNVEYLPSFMDLNDYMVNADLGLRVAMTGSLFLEYKFTFSYDAQPAPGAGNTDLRHLLSIGVRF